MDLLPTRQLPGTRGKSLQQKSNCSSLSTTLYIHTSFALSRPLLPKDSGDKGSLYFILILYVLSIFFFLWFSYISLSFLIPTFFFLLRFPRGHLILCSPQSILLRAALCNLVQPSPPRGSCLEQKASLPPQRLQ